MRFHHENFSEDPYYQRQRCSAMTVVFGNIRFMRIFAWVPWRRGVKRQWSKRKRRFSGLSVATRLRHLRKWGEHCYIVLFSPLSVSPFQWPQNTWPWMILNGHFTLNFTITNSHSRNYFLHSYSRVCLHTWPTEMFGSGPWSAEYLESAEKLRIFRRRYIVRTLTNKANISSLLSPFHWFQNTWPWMTLNGYTALNSVLRRYVWNSEAWLSKLGYS